MNNTDEIDWPFKDEDELVNLFETYGQKVSLSEYTRINSLIYERAEARYEELNGISWKEVRNTIHQKDSRSPIANNPAERFEAYPNARWGSFYSKREKDDEWP